MYYVTHVSTLNEKQQEAVKNTDGPMLIIAGAGSGKTRVLTSKIAHIMQEGKATSEEILAVTFTNKAAREMKDRIASILEGKIPESTVQGMWISTFHSACARILRYDLDKLGMGRSYIIYDSSDQKNIIKNIMKNLDIDPAQFRPDAIRHAISSAKNELISAEEYQKFALDRFTKNVARVYPEYQKELKAQNALDFDDILYNTVRLFKEFPDVLKKYQNKFKYVLVDEYQDTNVCQYCIVKMLADKHHNITVVGDGDQNIYTWRGANVHNIDTFEKDFKKTKIVMLEQNYRSTPEILKAANTVISQAADRKDKNLWTDQEKGEGVLHYKAYNEHEEAQFIASTIMSMSSEGYDYGDFAVLYRTNAQSRVVEDALMSKAIRYQLVGSMKFYERKEIKDIISYLRVVYNLNDTYSLIRVINNMISGIGNTLLGKLQQYADENGLTLFEALGKNDVLKGKTAITANTLYDNMMALKEESLKKGFVLSEFIELAIEKTAYKEFLKKTDTKTADDRIDNLMEFVSVAREQECETLDDFLVNVALLSDTDDIDSGNDAVTMMTLHSAKGLEFPVVFLVGVEEGLIPHFRAQHEEADIDEERRLLYVGMTRAEKKLFILSVVNRTLFGKSMCNDESRFVLDLSEDIVARENSPRIQAHSKKINFVAESGITFHSKKASGVYDNKNIEHEPYTIGDAVIHPSFGRGYITFVLGNGNDTSVTVKFDDQLEKTLILKYAPLSKA